MNRREGEHINVGDHVAVKDNYDTRSKNLAGQRGTITHVGPAGVANENLGATVQFDSFSVYLMLSNLESTNRRDATEDDVRLAAHKRFPDAAEVIIKQRGERINLCVNSQKPTAEEWANICANGAPAWTDEIFTVSAKSFGELLHAVENAVI